MSTFYGGEQLVQVVTIDAVDTDFDFNELKTIYTIPTGHYGILKYFFVATNNSSYPNSGGTFDAVILHKNITLNTTTFNTGYFIYNTGRSHADQRKIYTDRITEIVNSGSEFPPDLYLPYNFYMKEGDRVIMRSFLNNQNTRYELELHLYKKP